MNINDIWNIALLALCVFRESRGEPIEGKIGVAWTIKNRVNTPHAWWGQTLPDVILKPYQFSSFNPDDPNAKKIPGDPQKNPAWQECLTVAEQVYRGTVADPTNGSTHYCSMTLNPLPEWTHTAQFKVKLGTQLFYKTP